MGTRSSRKEETGQNRYGRLVGRRAAYSCVTSNFKGHNFFVRTPFWVLLDSMEIPLSHDSSHIPVVGSGYWSWLERGIRAGQVG